MMKIYILVATLFLYSLNSQGQKLHELIEANQPKFEKLNSNNGLIHNSITTIYQDSKGYMWFGTFNGLYKYDGYSFKIFKSKTGNPTTLIASDISTITEDSSGILWVGTKSGICFYNRDKDQFCREIKTTNKASSTIINNKINCIYQDSYNSIWVGTDEGLYKFTPNEKGYNLDVFKSQKNSNSLSDNYVQAIIEDKNKDLWVGTRNGLNKISFKRQGDLLFTVFKSNSKNNNSISHNNITSFCEDNEGNLWIGTKKGLNKLLKNNFQLRFEKYFHNAVNKNSLAHNHITTITKDINKTLWIGTRYGGVSRYFPNKNKKQFINYRKDLQNNNAISTNEIKSIFEGENGVLWIGGVAGSLNKVVVNKNKIAHYKYNARDINGLSDNKINVLFEDSTQHLWIGTINGGLNKLDFKNNAVQFIHYKNIPNSKNSLSSNNIFSFCEDNYGNFWAGTENNGLNQIKLLLPSNPNKTQIQRFTKENSAIPSNNISTLFKDKLGDIWMSSFDGDGLMKFTPNKFGEKLPKIEHFIHNPENKNSLSSNNVSCIFEDSESVLWVGTYGGGLLKIFRDSNNIPVKYIRIQNDPSKVNSLSSNNVFSIHEDKKGNLWIGTFGGGLNKLARSEKLKDFPEFKIYGEKQGLSNEELYGILEDKKGNLWISSNNGIFKFNIEKETFTNLQVNDGIQALNFRKFAYCKGTNGLMYFGGINGFNIFNPDEFKSNPFTPNIEITDFKIFNEPVIQGQEILGSVILNKAISETESIVLNDRHNTFSFEFSGLHYSSPEQNSYAYMLEGFDKKWIYTGAKRRFANYSNLNPGNYIFKVKASNNDNLWNENFKQIKIEVLPPLWKTWWAYIIYAVLFMGLMFLFRKYIVLNEEYQNKLKIEKLEQENIKKINNVKLEFFTNISHEFKTPLTLILGPLQNLMLSNDLTPKIKNTLSLMERNSNRLLRLINQVIEFRKIENKELNINPSKGNLVKFCKEVVDSFQYSAEQKKLKITFNSNKNKAQILFDWDKLEKILNNLISNSIKNTLKDGSINVSLIFYSKNEESVTKSKFVKLIIKDNGVGIPEDYIKLIFDRFLQIENLNISNSSNSGIGLALTKTLVELNNGTIDVKSKENIGSQFTLTFPLIKVSQKATNFNYSTELSDVQNQLFEVPSSRVLNTENKNNSELPLLLIVEDSYDLQMFIKDSLADQFNIIQAENGEKGLELALSEVPDIIISDVMMPIKNGIELCHDLKKNHITSHIPIILLTAKSAIEHQIEGLQVGADAYISKPFNTVHLQVRLHKLLEQRKLLKEKFSIETPHQMKEGDKINKFESEFLEKIHQIIEKNIDNPQFDIETLGEGLNFSRMQLYRKLKSISSLTANELIRNYRINKAAKYMEETDMNISEIGYAVGFNNLSYFTKCFKKTYNMSPSEFMKGNKV